jgi:hypothetical protein
MIVLAGGKAPAVPAADEKLYPLARLLDLADALQLGPPSAATAAAALRDPCAVVRYWAVTGTLMWKVAPDVAPLLDDPDASVRVAAAEAVLRRGASDPAWRVLATALEPTQVSELRLAVLNALTYLPAAPESLRALVATAAKSDKEYVGRAAGYLVNARP